MATNTRKAGPKIDAEHIVYLVDKFKQIDVDGYEHDDKKDYKMIGMALKKAGAYDMMQLEGLLDFYMTHGMKHMQSLQGFLVWAFKNPLQARSKNYVHKGVRIVHGTATETKPRGRDFYDNLFATVDEISHG